MLAYLEELLGPVEVPSLGLDGLEHDPGDGGALLGHPVDLLLDGGQAARVLRPVLPVVLGQRVLVPREVRRRPLQGRDVNAVHWPGIIGCCVHVTVEMDLKYFFAS